MKTETFFDFLHLRLPQPWDVRKEDDRLWGCFDKSGQGGTLWVDYDIAPAPLSVEDQRASVDSLLLTALRHPGTLEARLLDVPVGMAVSVIRDSREDEDEAVRNWYLHHLRWSGPRCLTVRLTYVLPTRLLEQPHIRDLAWTMERAMREAEIGDWNKVLVAAE